VQPSYLHGHFALSSPSSRHSGCEGCSRPATLNPDTVLPISSCDVRSPGLQASPPDVRVGSRWSEPPGHYSTRSRRCTVASSIAPASLGRRRPPTFARALRRGRMREAHGPEAERVDETTRDGGEHRGDPRPMNGCGAPGRSHGRPSSKPPSGSRPYRRARRILCLSSRSVHGGSHAAFHSFISTSASSSLSRKPRTSRPYARNVAVSPS